MQILFFGQRGLPANDQSHTDEVRVEALSAGLANNGHTVYATSVKSYTKCSLRHYNGIEILYRLPLNPHAPGGWLHLLSCLAALWKKQPDAVHVHGWKAACLVRIAALLSPESSYIWTVSPIPKLMPVWAAKLLAWQAKAAFDSIVSPTRELQYVFGTLLGIKTSYIPDGYTPPVIPEIPPVLYGLRRGQYAVGAACLADISRLADTYSQVKTRKKLIIVTEELTQQHALLRRKYSFLRFVQAPIGGRAHVSLIRQAAALVAYSNNQPIQLILQAMDSSRPVIAVNSSIYQETLGTNGLFFAPQDDDLLLAHLQAAVSRKGIGTAIGKAAKDRAQAHFSWHRVESEYMVQYHSPVIRKVPLDSIIPRPQEQLSYYS